MIHIVPSRPSHTNVKPGTELSADVKTWHVDDVETDTDQLRFRLSFPANNSTGYFGLGIVGPTSLHNALDRSGFTRIAQGPEAYLFPLATVISSYRPDRDARVVYLNDGDLIITDQYVLIVQAPTSRFGEPTLAISHRPEAAQDRSDHVAQVQAKRDARNR